MQKGHSIMSFSFSDGSLRLPNLCQYHQNVLQHYYRFFKSALKEKSDILDKITFNGLQGINKDIVNYIY